MPYTQLHLSCLVTFQCNADVTAAVATVILTCASIAAAIFTAGLFFAACWQLPLIAKQIRLTREFHAEEEHRERMWRTLEACNKFDNSPSLEASMLKIWTASNEGKEYQPGKIDGRDAMHVLNFLDDIAIGIGEKIYIEEVAKRYMDEHFKKP